MSKQISEKIDDGLHALGKEPGFLNAQKVINDVISLLGIDADEWIPFNDSRRRIFNRADWFHAAHGFRDRRATYKMAPNNGKNIDLKAYWVKRKRKSVVQWVVALTPNFEDEPYNKRYNIGIDFIIPDKADRIQVILSKRYVLRVLELKSRLAPTQWEAISKWRNLDFHEKQGLHDALWQTFELNPVNKGFYEGVAIHFYRLRDFLRKDIFNEKESNAFTIRLIGRIMFCWFLDKKGFIEDRESYFSLKEGQSDKDHYQKKLSFLFFNLLNIPEEKRNKEDKWKVPYLNGGLFDEHLDNQMNGFKRLDFPTGFFKDLFGFLRRYNFITDESSSSFQYVAIDPEMLGKIFENLLAERREETGEQAKKAKGFYYTPRNVVDYMCKEALREWLRQRLPKETRVDECLRKLFDVGWHEFQDQKKNYVRDHVKRYKDAITSALEEVRILDPACGSGAFLVAMMRLIVDLHERINAVGIKKRKLEVVRNNIHGVDIDPMAVEVSKLRIWLSLIIDQNPDGKEPLALPNLDFKFVCADFLIGSKDPMIFDEEFERMRSDYFLPDKRKDKKELQKSINDKIASSFFLGKKQTFDPFQRSKASGFFSPEIMFGIQEGFDVAIGNFPRSQFREGGGRLVDMYKDCGFVTWDRQGGICQLFYEKACDLLKPENGTLSCISSNGWLKAEHGKGTRRHLGSGMRSPLRLVDMGRDVFQKVVADSCILILSNGKCGVECRAVGMDRLSDTGFPPSKKDWGGLSRDGDSPWVILSPLGQSTIFDHYREGA